MRLRNRLAAKPPERKEARAFKRILTTVCDMRVMGLSHEFTAGSAQEVLTAQGLETLRAIYPLRPGVLTHSLVDHPLLSREKLAVAASRMKPADVECRAAHNRNGSGFAMAEPVDGDPSTTIRQIERSGRWVMLRHAEQLPEYAELFDSLQNQIAPVLEATTGPGMKAVGFIFVSSPGALTPYHFDPEYNVLCQVAGTKCFASFPAKSPWLPVEAQEQFYRLEENLLPFDKAFCSAQTIYPLAPGDAVFMPYAMPHWVQVGEEPSVSISLTWRTRCTIEHDLAWRFNGWLRARGLDPRSVAPMPHRPLLKSKAMAALQRLGLD